MTGTAVGDIVVPASAAEDDEGMAGEAVELFRDA